MKSLLLIGVLTVAGCAGHPSEPTAAPTTYVSPTGQPLASASQSDLDAQRLADAKKRGYKLVNTDGKELYCRSDLETGSHLVKKTTCLTAEELEALKNETKMGLQTQIKPMAAPSGR